MHGADVVGTKFGNVSRVFVLMGIRHGYIDTPNDDKYRILTKACIPFRSL